MRGDGNKDEVRLIQKSMKEAKMMHEGDSLFSSAETSSKLPLDKDFVENFMWAVCVCRGGGGVEALKGAIVRSTQGEVKPKVVTVAYKSAKCLHFNW